MPTEICRGGSKARFTASHNGSSTYFESPNTPLIREDYESYLTRTASAGSSGAMPMGGVRQMNISVGDGIARLAVVQVYSGAGVIIYADNKFIGTFLSYAPDHPDKIVLGKISTLTIVGSSNQNVTVGVDICGLRWGHKVTDSKGLSKIFLSNSFSKPAPFSSTCTAQCSAGNAPCNGCCFNCSTASKTVRSMLARLS